jgi:TatD DNase family protein
MPHFQDAHLHLQDPRIIGETECILTELQALGINKLVVNGTSPADWDQVRELNKNHPEVIIPSYGLHPWKTPCSVPQWKDSLEDYITSDPNACIGECGLDKWIRNPNIEAQEDAFRFQIELAARLNRPLSIHVLKAWGWLLEVLETSPPPARGFMLHGFGGSKEIAQQLVKHGAYFSFCGYFLQERKQSVQDAFKSIPLDRILIETDAPDMLAPVEFITHPLKEKTNHPANLVATARGLASLLAMDFEELSNHLEANFARFFLAE